MVNTSNEEVTRRQIYDRLEDNMKKLDLVEGELQKSAAENSRIHADIIERIARLESMSERLDELVEFLRRGFADLRRLVEEVAARLKDLNSQSGSRVGFALILVILLVLIVLNWLDLTHVYDRVSAPQSAPGRF